VTSRPRLVAALVALVLSSGLAACGGDDSSDAERELAKSIAGKTGADVKFVECPDGVKTGSGQTFNCTALVPVSVTQIEENGEARWQITSLTGPPGEAKGSTGAAGATAATGATGPAPVAFGPHVPYRNTEFRYQIRRPSTWTQRGSGQDVIFASPPYFVHIYASKGRLRTPSEIRSVVRKDKRVTRIEISDRVVLRGRTANRIQFLLKPKAGPQQRILRIQYADGGNLANVDFGTPAQQVASGYVAAQRRMIASFRFL
jgi:hypothetical protein